MEITEEFVGTLPPNGWLLTEEAQLLYEVASDCDGAILEVGSYYGRSTCLLATLRRPVYAVDPFSDFDTGDPSGDVIIQGLRNNLAERGLHNVMIFREKIESWKPRPCGFAYLDGDHTYAGTVRQINAAIACGVQDMCIHDYGLVGGGALIAEAINDSLVHIVEVVDRIAHCRYGKP